MNILIFNFVNIKIKYLSNYKLCDKNLKKVSCVRGLGVVLFNDLNFLEYVNLFIIK